MTLMTGGEALVKSLYREGVRVVFGLPGVQIYHTMDALAKEPGIRFINARHEQATTYMADGYARASGKIGTALVVPGPGLLNATAGLGTAYAASSPVLLVAGQIERDQIGKNRGALHEIHDQLDTIRPLTKWASRVLDPNKIPSAVSQAFYHLRTGRPRPVELEIPPETMSEVANIELREAGEYGRPTAHKKEILQGARILADAKNPLIWAGGGVISSGASEALRQLAEYLQAPVITSIEGKGSLSDRHYLNLGVPRGLTSSWALDDPLRAQVIAADVVLAVGTRFVLAPSVLDGQRVVQIDVDHEEIGRNYANTFAVCGDARRSLEDFLTVLAPMTPNRSSRRRELEAIKTDRFDHNKQVEPLGSYVRAIRAAMPDDGIFVGDMTQVSYHGRVFYPVYEPGTYLTSSYFGNLGFAFPTALGAKVAQPDRPVVAVCGDGGFLYNSQELATAVQHNINAVVIVFNDNAYGNVLRDQLNSFEGRTIGASLHNPDFVKLAEAYGVTGIRVEGPDALEATLRNTIGADAPFLIEVPVGMMPSPH
jgi:acetolactate synthase-1/2/3 large subunit